MNFGNSQSKMLLNFPYILEGFETEVDFELRELELPLPMDACEDSDCGFDFDWGSLETMAPSISGISGLWQSANISWCVCIKRWGTQNRVNSMRNGE